MDKGTEDDRGRDGRTNFTWRIKEQATRLNPLFEHDDDDLQVSQFKCFYAFLNSPIHATWPICINKRIGAKTISVDNY